MKKIVIPVLIAVAITFAAAGFSDAGGRGGGGHGSKGGSRGFHGRVGSAFYWGPYWWWWAYPPYAYLPYPYPPTVIVEPPPVYVEAPTPGYWYYCHSAREYYPTVDSCDEGWVRVAPETQ